MYQFGTDETAVLAMLFVAVFLLLQAFVLPVFGENRKIKRRMKARLRGMRSEGNRAGRAPALREKYLRDLSPVERRLEALPGMASLQALIEQAGSQMPAYRLVLLSVTLFFIGAGAAFTATGKIPLALLLGTMASAVPGLKMKMNRAKRLARFEEQFADALTVMGRSLRAGHPFSEALHMVSEEMPEPVGAEFSIMFSEINYGGAPRDALLGLLERVPSVPVMAFVSSVLIQQETGGNLAELLDKLAEIVRSRFRFQRRLRTLTAQGKMAAWVLSLLPFFLAGALTVVNPTYMPMMTKDPTGRTLVVAFFVLVVIGILWITRIVRIDV
jgi:tight adherence protein B